jgi:hypothetical protein
VTLRKGNHGLALAAQPTPPRWLTSTFTPRRAVSTKVRAAQTCRAGLLIPTIATGFYRMALILSRSTVDRNTVDLPQDCNATRRSDTGRLDTKRRRRRAGLDPRRFRVVDLPTVLPRQTSGDRWFIGHRIECSQTTPTIRGCEKIPERAEGTDKTSKTSKRGFWRFWRVMRLVYPREFRTARDRCMHSKTAFIAHH